MNYPGYKRLVNTFEQLIDQKIIDQNRFTPSDISNACILACINHEMWHTKGVCFDTRLKHACIILAKNEARGKL